MGAWILPVDLLARSRFVVSPLAETVAALTVLSGPDAAGLPWEHSFRAQHREAYLRMLAASDIRAAIADCLWRPRRGSIAGWMADFLGLPPVGRDASFEDELAQLAAWDDDAIRAEIALMTGRPVPAALAGGPGLAGAVTGILRWVWEETVAPDWPRRREVLEADIVARASRLASHGWADVFAALGSRTRWLGEGQLQINGYDLPGRDLSQARELSFVPAHSSGGWAAWDLPDRFALVYPVAGALADVGRARPPSGLARLIGANRALILRLLDRPHSTTQLAALTALPMGAVSSHLKVLLEAGAVSRRRTGREVLYWRTPLGDALAAS